MSHTEEELAEIEEELLQELVSLGYSGLEIEEIMDSVRTSRELHDGQQEIFDASASEREEWGQDD